MTIYSQKSYRQNALWMQVLKLPRSTAVIRVKNNRRSKIYQYICIINCTSLQTEQNTYTVFKHAYFHCGISTDDKI